MSDVRKAKESIYTKFFTTRLLPLWINEWDNALTREMRRHAGCIRKQEKAITPKKFTESFAFVYDKK